MKYIILRIPTINITEILTYHVKPDWVHISELLVHTYQINILHTKKISNKYDINSNFPPQMHHTYPYNTFTHPFFTVFTWCQQSMASGTSGICVVKTSTASSIEWHTRYSVLGLVYCHVSNNGVVISFLGTSTSRNLVTVSVYHLHAILQGGRYHYSGIPMTMYWYAEVHVLCLCVLVYLVLVPKNTRGTVQVLLHSYVVHTSMLAGPFRMQEKCVSTWRVHSMSIQ